MPKNYSVRGHAANVGVAIFGFKKTPEIGEICLQKELDLSKLRKVSKFNCSDIVGTRRFPGALRTLVKVQKTRPQ